MAVPSVKEVGTFYNPGTSGTTIVVDKPSSVVAGNLMLAHLRFMAGVITAIPTGWTTIDDPNSVDLPKSILAWKVATGSEPSSYTFTFSSATNNRRGVIIAFEGNDLITPINAQASSAQVSVVGATGIVIPQVTTTARDVLLITATAIFGSATQNTPSGWSRDWNPHSSMCGFSRQQTSPGLSPSGNITMSSNDTSLKVFTGAIAPPQINRPAIAHHYRQMRG